MSVFAEFVCVAIALYLWECALWLPLRGVALRRQWFGNKWKVLTPGSLIAGRNLGMVPMLPLPPDPGFAPCQAPPLLVDDKGGFLMETSDGGLRLIGKLEWEDLKTEEHHLLVRDHKTRIFSDRCVEVLRRAKKRGQTPEAAVTLSWKLALSPNRARQEWRRWKLVSGPLRWYGPLLTLGFWVGLPLVYLYRGNLQIGIFAGWLWCVMAFISAHLWWLGKRVYPAARSALRMDALLSLVVPFHAMRALEIASAHAMGATHPAGLILSSGDLENPWLGKFIRRILHPMPGVREDTRFSSAVRPHLSNALSRCGKTLEDFDVPPAAADSGEAANYCPRCHGIYQIGTGHCPDCRGMELRSLA